MRGTVKWFNDQRGYGFVIGEDGKEYFVHWTGIVSTHKFKKLMQDDTVEFNLGENDKGECATDVCRVMAN